MGKQYKRRTYLINRTYQLNLTGAILLVCVGTMIATALITSFCLIFFNETVQDPNAERLMVYMTIWAGLFGVYLVYAGIHITHKTAGPMYHILRVLELVRKGDFSQRIKLRKSDYWHDVADACNHLIDQAQGQGASGGASLKGLASEALARHPEDGALKKIVELLGDFPDSEKRAG